MVVRGDYKQTNVGVFPKDWEVKPLGELSEIVTSGSRGWARYYSDRGPLFVRSQNIRDGHLDFTDRQCVIPPVGSEGSRTRLKQSDLLITMTGNSVGNVAWVKQDLGEAYISQHVGLVRLLEPSFAEYICLFLAPGSPGNWQIWASQTGQSKPGLNLKNLEEFCVALPPLLEQSAITEALSDADALIESLEQLIAKKRQIKQGAMQELLTGKRCLPGGSGTWETKRLGDTASLKARIGWQGLTTSEHLDYGAYYLVTGTEFTNGHIDWNSCHYVGESRYKQDRHIQLKERDVLVTKDGTIGKVAFISVLPRQATLNSGVFVIRPRDDAFYPEFFYHLLCSNIFTDFLAQLSAGSTINHLYQKDFVNFIYTTPSTIEEQSAIAAILSDMDTEIAALESKLDKARHIKQGMMQELLTGRIRLV